MELLNDEIRNDLIITAIEGGSNYWYFLDNEACDIINQYKDKGMAFSEAILPAINDENKIPIHDCETGDLLGYLSKESIEKGEESMYKEFSDHFSNSLNENWDAETADVWFQLCVMGELVYG